MIEKLVSVLPNTGSVPFEQFVIDARMAGANPGLWLRAKHEGKINTRIIGGVLHVERATEGSGQ